MNDQNTALVSVITGYYNRGHLLERTLESILAQSYKNIELIIFDDCSTDDTRVRLQKYIDRGDPRIKVILHEQNKGFVRGMIDAIAQARGEYIAVQSSGDISLPERITEQVNVLNHDCGVGVVGCHYENVIEQHGITRLRTPNANETTLETLLCGNVFSHGEVMFRRTHYEQVGGYRPEFKYCQDYDLWLRMIKVCSFRTVPKLLFKRYVQFDGVSYAPRKAILQARYFLLCQRIARADSIKQEKMLGVLRTGRVEEVVPLDDPALQKRVLRACLRSIVWGEVDSAITYSQNLSNPLARAFVKLVGRTMHSSFLAMPRKALFRALGVKSA